MTLIQLVQHVCDELGLPRPSLIVGNTDDDVRQMSALLSRLGTDLVNTFAWQRLQKEYIFSTVATTLTGTTTAGSTVITGISDTTGLSNYFCITGDGILPFAQIVTVDSGTQVTMTMPASASGTVSLTFSQVQYDLPSDWAREIPQTEWNRTNRWPLLGPSSPQDWQEFKSGVVYPGPRERFRIVNNTYAINPPPPNGLIFSMEYMSKGWIISSGQNVTAFQADTDTFVFSDSLLITGLKTQWKMAKGIDASFDANEFRSLLDMAKGQDKSSSIIYMTQPNVSLMLNIGNVQDGNYPSA